MKVNNRKTSFVLHLDMLEDLDDMTVVEKAALLDFVVGYNNGTVSINDIPNGAEKRYFRLFANQFDRDTEKWEITREARSAAGKKGGRPKKQSKAKKANASLEKQSKAKKAVNVKVNGNVDVDEKGNEDVLSLVDLAAPKSTTEAKSISNDDCPYSEIVASYNEILGSELQTCKIATPARKAALRRTWAFLNHDTEAFRKYFQQVKASDFLCGRTKKSDWKSGFDWLMIQKNVVKIIEGNFANA